MLWIGNKNMAEETFTITQVAQQFGINPSKIRFWETEFVFLRPSKSPKGNRFYTAQDIEKLRLVHHLVETEGYTLEGARKRLQTPDKTTENYVKIQEHLQKIKHFLTQLDQQIDQY